MRKFFFITAWIALGFSVSQWVSALLYQPHYFPYDFKEPSEMFEGRFQHLQTLQSFQDYMDSLARAKKYCSGRLPRFR
jgi:hypothetical protein